VSSLLGSLGGFIDNAVPNSKSIEIQLNAFDRTIFYQLILIVKIVVESGTVLEITLKSVFLLIKKGNK